MLQLSLLAALCAAEPGKIRVAVFNVWELSAEKLDREGGDAQLRGAAEIVQRVRPDILLVNEIDYAGTGAKSACQKFATRYLAVGQNGLRPIKFQYTYTAPVNTGVPSGKDFDNDGKMDGPADAYGYGRYPGQYGMAIYSRLPIQKDQVRTFQKLLWKDMPKNLMPDGTGGKPKFYSPDEVNVFRLSSKSHWDVPIRVGGKAIHILCSHPTPPVFDGAEDRNGRRNYDEIRLWADYLTGGDAASYIRDDAGKAGGQPAGEPFLIMGDLNAEPTKGDAAYGQPAAMLLLKHPRVYDPKPCNTAGSSKTCNFGRIDYVLPSKDLKVVGCGVFDPRPGDAARRLVTDRKRSSDHRLVWVDIKP